MRRLNFLVAAYDFFLIEGRSTLKIDFQDVDEGDEGGCPVVVQTVVERQAVALLL